MTERKIRIYADRNAGTSRTIDLYLDPDGTIRLSGGDVGLAPQAAFGDSDYEFWVNIPPENVATLCFALLRDKLSGEARAVDMLNDYCKTEAIACSFDTWR